MRFVVSIEIFFAFLRLGLTSFGGPVAHLAYFHREFVERRAWLDDDAYAELVALCQVLPGPASSQVGIGLGLLRGGIAGSLAAWLGFTLPSALALTALALVLRDRGLAASIGAVHGLKVAAVAVVAQAVWSLGKKLCPDRPRLGLALAAGALSLLVPGSAAQLGAIVAGALVGALFLVPAEVPARQLRFDAAPGKMTGAALLLAFALLLFTAPVLAHVYRIGALELFDRLYRSGALVFGGGHVVLPLLQAQFVESGLVDQSTFLAGYGAAQAVPGPLFTFAAYLGALSTTGPGGWIGAAIGVMAIFLPGYLLIVGVLPFWGSVRRHACVARALLGVNAAVVGLLLAAFYNPVWTSAIGSLGDLALAAVALALLQTGKAPPWLVVGGCAAIGAGIPG